MSSRRAAVAACILCSCTLVHERAREEGPQSRPARDEGMLAYSVGRLSFEAPAAWTARGDPRHVLLVSPAGDARIDAQLMERTFPDDARCLAQAEQALARGGSRLTNVRRHPSTLAGRRSVAQEADQDRWHGWAWAVCDGGEQYRIFFTGLSPLKEESVRIVRSLPASAVLAPRPTARSGVGRSAPVAEAGPSVAARARAAGAERAEAGGP
jgi:hypothetical protein